MGMKMKELPPGLRPYEKFRLYGAEALDDAELLAVLLRSGTRNESALEVSRNLLSASGGTLAGFYAMTEKTFSEIPGIGPVKAMQLQCLKTLASRMEKSRLGERPDFSRPENVYRFFAEEFRGALQETVTALFLNTKMKLLRALTVSKGTVNASIVPTREILISALRENAVYAVLVHNHPSGDPEPSAEDVSVTRTLISAGNLCGIRFIDHVIIGDGRYVSLRERGVFHDCF